jgi:hypothetical protein
MSIEDFFGESISTYTRTQALEDGVLVAVDTATACEAGFRVPLALTAAVHSDCVAWTEEDARRTGAVQDEAGRLWDVLTMARGAIARAIGSSRLVPFEVYRVSRDGGRRPRPVPLVVAAGPGDDGNLVLTVLLKGED